MTTNILKNRLYTWALFLMALHSGEALQEYTPQKNRRIEAIVSKNNLNRISFEHDRIRQVYAGGEYDLEIDQDQGQIFIRPQQSGPIHLSLVTEKGYTQDMTLRAKGMTPQTIIVKQEKEGQAGWVEASSSPSQLSSYKKGIRRLMKAMVEGQALDGFQKSTSCGSLKVRAFPAGIEGAAEFVYQGQSIQGVVYRIQNTSDHDYPVTEEELSQPGDRALFLTNPVLRSGEWARVFVIRTVRSESSDDVAQNQGGQND